MSVEPDSDDVAQDWAGEALNVRVIETVTEQEAPAWGTWRTFSWAANATVSQTAQRILPYDKRRAKARIFVMAGAAAAVTAYVQIGQREQVMNGQGGQLLAGVQAEMNNSQETWISSDGTNAMIVTVLQERYQ
jgi:hypothetical protein